MKKFFYVLLLSTLIVTLVFSRLYAIGIPKIPDIPDIKDKISEKIPGLDKILEGEPALETGINDAKTGISFLDDFDPEIFTSMTVLPRTEEGDFILVNPGLYSLKVESFCLRAGTYGPTEGDGYLMAGLKGSKADIIHKILRGVYSHPDIEQSDIQILLWAIIARTKLSDMSRENQLIAAKLLSPAEIFELNEGALGLIPEDKKREAFNKVPDEIRSVIEAEANIREKLTQTDARFEEIEEIAVRTGIAPEGKGSRNIPRGRWSYHEDGFFVRYFPEGYSRNLIQIYVPGTFSIETDEMGRITRLDDRKGNIIGIEYSNDTGGKSGDMSFKRVHFINRVTIPPEISIDLEASWENITAGQGSYNMTKKLSENLEKLGEVIRINGDRTKLMNLAYLKDALKELIDKNKSGEPAWVENHIDLINKAWQYEFSRLTCGYSWGYLLEENTEKSGTLLSVLKAFIAFTGEILFPQLFAESAADKIPWFDPSEGGSIPGNVLSQVIGNSFRPADKNGPCAQAKNDLAFAELAQKAYKSVDPSNYDNGKDFNDAVMDKLNDMLQKEGKAGADPGHQSNAPMGTHPTDCRIGPGGPGSNYDWDWKMYGKMSPSDFEDYIKDNYFKNSSDMSWEGAREHEQSHIESCQEQTAKNGPDGYKDWMNDPKNYQQDEVDAYQRQIDKLKQLIEENCK